MMYPQGIRLKSHVGTMVYRGETIKSYFRLEDRSFPGAAVRNLAWFKYYYHGNLGSPSLARLLNSIDYTQAGVSKETEKLVAVMVGTRVNIGLQSYLKTNCQHAHEAPGNWFVNLLTGKLAHAGDLAAQLCNYTPRYCGPRGSRMRIE